MEPSETAFGQVCKIRNEKSVSVQRSSFPARTTVARLPTARVLVIQRRKAVRRSGRGCVSGIYRARCALTRRAGEYGRPERKGRLPAADEFPDSSGSTGDRDKSCCCPFPTRRSIANGRNLPTTGKSRMTAKPDPLPSFCSRRVSPALLSFSQVRFPAAPAIASAERARMREETRAWRPIEPGEIYARAVVGLRLRPQSACKMRTRFRGRPRGKIIPDARRPRRSR